MRLMNLSRWIILLIVLLLPSVAGAYRPVVTADQTYYDINTGLYMLNGNVTVRIKDAEIYAPTARVSLANLEVYAENGVRVVQGDTCFSGDSVYVRGKEHSASIAGNISLEDNGKVFSAPTADFNWKTKRGLYKCDDYR